MRHPPAARSSADRARRARAGRPGIPRGAEDRAEFASSQARAGHRPGAQRPNRSSGSTGCGSDGSTPGRLGCSRRAWSGLPASRKARRSDQTFHPMLRTGTEAAAIARRRRRLGGHTRARLMCDRSGRPDDGSPCRHLREHANGGAFLGYVERCLTGGAPPAPGLNAAMQHRAGVPAVVSTGSGVRAAGNRGRKRRTPVDHSRRSPSCPGGDRAPEAQVRHLARHRASHVEPIRCGRRADAPITRRQRLGRSSTGRA